MAKLLALAKDLNQIEEGLRPLYTETADGWVLDIDDKDYKKTLNEFRTNNTNLTKDKTTLMQAAEKYKDISPEKYEKAMHALEEIDKLEDAELIKAGKIDDVVKKRLTATETTYNQKIQALETATKEKDERLSTYRNRLGQMVVAQTIRGAIEKVGKLKEGAFDDVLLRATQNWDIDDDANPIPLDRNTKKPIYGAKGEALTPEEWATKLVTAAPHLFEGSKGSGARGNTTGTGTDGKIRVSRSDPLAMGRYSKEVANGTAIITE